MHFQAFSPKRVTSASFVITFNLLIATATIAVAWFLRRPGASALREKITEILMPEGRAIVEHFLAGYGCTMAVTMVLLAFYLIALGKQPPILPDGSAYTQLRRGALLSLDWLSLPAVRLAAVCGAIYLCGTVGYWEVMQAYFGVNGQPPRNYLQYGQIAADVLGAVLGVLHTSSVPACANRRG